MERLARDPKAFIRPSPSGGSMGGVAHKTREAMLLCEAAGFDVIMIETVGVGQSEIAVGSMVDFFLLLTITGAGDELQGIKRGVIELADVLVVNKADGDNRRAAEALCEQYNQLLPHLMPATEGWQTKALACSSLTGAGIEEVWEVIEMFAETTKASRAFERRRQRQALDWMRLLVDEQLRLRFAAHPKVREMIDRVEKAVTDGTLPPTAAAQMLLDEFEG
jgi:LAO/AO transport system kinase